MKSCTGLLMVLAVCQFGGRAVRQQGKPLHHALPAQVQQKRVLCRNKQEPMASWLGAEETLAGVPCGSRKELRAYEYMTC
jgi:hypothetical protein